MEEQTNQTENTEDGLTGEDKWYELTKEYREYERPSFTKARVAKDALISLIPGSLFFNGFLSLGPSLRKRDETAIEVYDKLHPGVKTIREPLVMKLFNGACKLAGLYPAYLLEASIVANSVSLYSGSDYIPRNIIYLGAGLLAKTAINCGFRYVRDYTNNRIN